MKIKNKKQTTIFVPITIIALLIIIGTSLFNSSSAKSDKSSRKEKIYELKGKTSFFNTLLQDFNYYTFDKITDCYHVYDKNEKLNASVLFSSPYCDKIIGYDGHIPFAIIINPDQRIREIILFENNETPEWIDDLHEEKFFNSWDNLTIEEAIKKKVDAISGATYSSDAVIESMSRRLDIYSKAINIK